MSTRWKTLIGIGIALVAINVGLRALEELTGGTPGGPASSSYATAPDGLRAYAELLARHGHEVRRVRTLPGETRLDAATTVVVADAGFVLRDDRAALRRFVEDGGRLVAAGSDPGGWTGRVVGGELEWRNDDVDRSRVLAPAAEVAGVRRVVGTAGGAWTETGSALPVLGEDERVLVAVASVGNGRVVALADAGPLQNSAIARADNARLGLALAGPSDRDVHFFESYHGYGEATGFGAIPDDWWAAFTLGLLAAAMLVLGRGRRFGPAEPEGRELPPPRRLYVDSLGGVLARTRTAAAVEPVRERARRLVAEAAGVSRGDDDGIARAARGLGLRDDEIAALRGEGRGAAATLAVGRALARLERRRRGRGEESTWKS